MTPQQSRAARNWLGWSQTKLASLANLSLSTVRDFETGKRVPIQNNVEAMKRALEAAGIEFLFDAQGEPTGITGPNDKKKKDS